MSIVIERGIPMPRAPKLSGKIVYPFGEMEVGDSFSVPLTGEQSSDGRTDKAYRRISCAAASWKRKNGRDFSTQIDRANSIVRCWRIA